MKKGDPIIERAMGWNPIIQLNPATFLCLSEARTGFPLSYVVVLFVFNDLVWEVIVCFVDIGGIVYHHWVNFLFLMSSSYRIMGNARGSWVFNTTFKTILVISWNVSFICGQNWKCQIWIFCLSPLVFFFLKTFK